MPIPCWFVVTFWVVAFVGSGLLGVYCREVHEIEKARLSGVRLAQQMWFNFIGALFGWAALWCLARHAWSAAWLRSSSTGTVTVSDFALGFVAFVGVSGYLPVTTMGAVYALRAFVVDVLKHLGGPLTGAK